MNSTSIKKRLQKKNYATGIQNLALFLSCFLFSFSACTDKTKTGRNGLLQGMYKLAKIEVQDSTGQWLDEWASDGTGYIVYDGIGHMAVQIMPKGYEQFKTLSEDESIDPGKVRAAVDSMPVEQLKASFEEFVANYVYTGDYSVSDSADVVTHHRLVHTIPSAWNSTVQRRFIFKGDTLELYNDVDKRRLTWIKQK